jgi:ankyrin repeat protein
MKRITMLTEQQKALTDAIQALDVAQVNALLAQGVDPNFIDEEYGPPATQICDRLFDWWEAVLDGYESETPLDEQQKSRLLVPYQEILQALIDAKANLHLWDAEEFFGPLWDAASAACVPVVRTLLAHKVDPNKRDDEGMTILSSICDLYFDVDYDLIDWEQTLPEERATVELLRQYGALTTAEFLAK